MFTARKQAEGTPDKCDTTALLRVSNWESTVINRGILLGLPQSLIRRMPELPSGVQAQYSILAMSVGCAHKSARQIFAF